MTVQRATGRVTFGPRFPMAMPHMTTLKRPFASVVGIGAEYFDTTLGKKPYSVGVAWVDGGGWRSFLMPVLYHSQ
ncbi:hypothetical protein CQ018_17605 [Arthrobacter sp. MYb227]|nr:hypothetical protein CQ018_17605 [Arthrobacter sp. MYb227]